MKGYIYKIVSNGLEPYYGSTTNFKARKWSHTSTFNQYNKGKGRFCYSFLHLENPDYKIILLEELDVENKTELLRIEGEYIKNNICINIATPYLSPEEKQERILFYREKTRESNKVYQKEYKKKSDVYQKNQDKLNVKVICPYCIKTISKRVFKYKHIKKCLINNKWKNLCINLLSLKRKDLKCQSML